MRKGITLIELVVVISVIALLVSLTLPAISAAREAARRMQCQNNLKQMVLAVVNYESDYGKFPDAGVHKVKLLPYLDRRDLYAKYELIQNLPLRPQDQRMWAWQELETTRIGVYLCPSDPAPEYIGKAPIPSATGPFYNGYATNYPGCYGTGFVRSGFDGFFDGTNHSAADITNGLSNTAVFSEWLHSDDSYDRLRVRWQTPMAFNGPNEYEAFANYCESIPLSPFSLGWRGSPFTRGVPWRLGWQGAGLYNHMLPPNRPSCNNLTDITRGIHTAGSMHGGSTNVALGDGHVIGVSSSIDRTVWRSMGSRIGPDSMSQ